MEIFILMYKILKIIPVLDIPKYSAAQINIMLHKSHTSISWPALFVIIADNVLIIRIGMFGQISLYELFSLVSSKSEQYMNSIDITDVESNWMGRLNVDILIGEKVVG